MHFVSYLPTFSVKRLEVLSIKWFPLLYSINTMLIPTCKQTLCSQWGNQDHSNTLPASAVSWWNTKYDDMPGMVDLE